MKFSDLVLNGYVKFDGTGYALRKECWGRITKIYPDTNEVDVVVFGTPAKVHAREIRGYRGPQPNPKG